MHSAGCDHPNVKDIYAKVIPHIPAYKWEDLGHELLDGDNVNVQLSHIKADNPENIEQRFRIMFDKWLLNRSATWNKLIAALENIKMTFLADNIKKSLLSNTGSFPCTCKFVCVSYLLTYVCA